MSPGLRPDDPAFRPGWRGFCSRPGCPCCLPDTGVCDTYQDSDAAARDDERCPECGWPASVHDLRDRMAQAGLRLNISAEREDAEA